MGRWIWVLGLWACDGEPAVEPDAAVCRASLTAVPDDLHFGQVEPFEARETTVELRNTGECDVRIDQLQINGSAAFDVLLDGVDPRRHPEALRDRVVPVRGTLPLIVRLTGPAARGTAWGDLVVVNTAGRLRVRLTGNDGPCLRAEVSTLSFRSVPQRESVQTLALRNCGGVPVTIRRATLREPESRVFSRVTGLPLAVAPGAVEAMQVSFLPIDAGTYKGQFDLETDQPEIPMISVALHGQAAENQCPVASVGPKDSIDVSVGDVVRLDGSGSWDPDGQQGRPIRWVWSADSFLEPVERYFEAGPVDDDPGTPTAEYSVELGGLHLLELRVTDANGCESAAPLAIRATSATWLAVALTWTGDADLDLHLLHPNAEAWFNAPYDCHFNNPFPDWGQLENPYDDPVLDQDLPAAGPETIHLAPPENTDVLGAPYRVGISRHAGGAAQATVRVSINGEPVWEETMEVDPVDGIHEVATISWPAGEVRRRP